MKTKVHLLAAIATLLASCASAPVAEVASPSGPPPETVRTLADFLRVEHAAAAAMNPVLQEALIDVQKGSPASLASCGKRLADAGLLEKDPNGREIAALARAVSGLLYPGTADGLPKDLPAYGGRYHAILDILASGREIDWLPLSAGDDFLTFVLPAFTLLRSSSPVSAPLLKRLEENLARADRLNAASVLPPYLQGLAAERRQQPDTQAAVAFYRESARRDASFRLPIRRLAALLPDTGAPGEAIPFLEALQKEAPTDLDALKKLASAALAAGDTEKALDATGKAILLAPEDVDLILMRAAVFEAQGNWYQALRIADIVIKQKPDEGRAYLIKARLLYDRQGDVQEAIRILDAAEPQFPAEAGFPELKGRILLETGRGDEGLKALERALTIEPARLSTMRLLLQDTIRMKRWLQATLYLAQILEKAATADDLLMAYQVFSNLGDHEQALQYAERLSRAMEGSTPLLLMTRSEIATNRKADAVGNIDKGLNRFADPAVRSELLYLKALTDREDPDAFLRDLRASLLENQDNIEALMAISDAFVRQSDFRLALIYLRRAVQLRPDDVGLGIQLKAVEKQVDQPE